MKLWLEVLTIVINLCLSPLISYAILAGYEMFHPLIRVFYIWFPIVTMPMGLWTAWGVYRRLYPKEGVKDEGA